MLNSFLPFYFDANWNRCFFLFLRLPSSSCKLSLVELQSVNRENGDKTRALCVCVTNSNISGPHSQLSNVVYHGL